MFKRIISRGVILVVYLVVLNIGYVIAAGPGKLNYQGRLRESGQPVSGTKNMEFKIWDDFSAGTEVWTSGTQVITISTGIFSYQLQPTNINWSTGQYWLEIVIDPSGENVTLSPREQLVASAYSFYSDDSDKLDGRDYIAFVSTTGDKMSGGLDIDASGSDYALRIGTGTTYHLVISSTGLIDMKGNTIKGLRAPIADDEAATKAYVDAAGEYAILVETQTLSAANETVSAGYYESTTLSAVDSDLAAGNIRDGVVIFGFTGTVDSAVAGSAVEADILSPKTADIDGDGVLETGTMPTQTLDAANETVSAGYYAATTLSEVDSDLSAGNISDGVVIFGFTGTLGSGNQLPDTGQELSYTATFGEDHDYTPAATQMSYTDNGLTVTDDVTGLMWVEDGNSAGCNNGNTLDWEAAITFCEGLDYGGYGDWRLPNARELMSIVDYGESSPAVNATYFPNTVNNYYWTSTTYVPFTTFAWVVTFSGGNVSNTNKTNTRSVRAVRSGP